MSLQGRTGDLITELGTDYKTFRTWLTGSALGTLASLATADKSSIIAAINEVKADAAAAVAPDASTTVKGLAETATLAEMATGTDSIRYATPEGVRQERTALKAEILGGVGPAFDTLLELANEEAADEAALTSLIGAKMAKSANLSDVADAAASRNNLSVYSKAELGDPETDLVAAYNTAKT